MKPAAGSEPPNLKGLGRLHSSTRGGSTAPARYYRSYSVAPAAVLIPRRIIEMHRRLPELIAELIAEHLLQNFFDSSSGVSLTFLRKPTENGRLPPDGSSQGGGNR